jgi:hypothetical protein
VHLVGVAEYGDRHAGASCLADQLLSAWQRPDQPLAELRQEGLPAQREPPIGHYPGREVLWAATAALEPAYPLAGQPPTPQLFVVVQPS